MHVSRRLRRSALLLLALPVAGLAAGCASGPASAVTGFYEALEDGRIEDATEYVSTDLRDQVPAAKLREGLRGAAQEIIDKGGIEEIEVTEEEVTGELGRVTVRIEYGNGEESVETTQVVLEDGTWRLKPEK